MTDFAFFHGTLANSHQEERWNGLGEHVGPAIIEGLQKPIYLNAVEEAEGGFTHGNLYEVDDFGELDEYEEKFGYDRVQAGEWESDPVYIYTLEQFLTEVAEADADISLKE